MPIGMFKCWRNKFGVTFFTLVCSHVALADLQIIQPWVKLAPPGAKANAAYGQLYNPGSEAVVVQSLSASCCASVMLHRTRYENDRAMMEHLEQLTIPAQGRVNLAPGSMHIMLMQAASPLRVGDTVMLQLHFSDGQQQVIQFPVKADDY